MSINHSGVYHHPLRKWIRLGILTIVILSSLAFVYHSLYQKPKVTDQIEELLEQHQNLNALQLSISEARQQLEKSSNLSPSLHQVFLKAVNATRERQQLPADTSAIAFSPDSQYLVTGHRDGNVRYWRADGMPTSRSFQIKPLNSDLETARMKSLKTEEISVIGIAFDKTSEKLVLSRSDGIMELRTFAGELLQVPWLGLAAHQLVFSPDGTRIAAASSKGLVGVWTVQGEALLSPISAHDGFSVNGIDFSPDSQMLITSDQKSRTQFWSRNGVRLNHLPKVDLLASPIDAAVFHPNGDSILTTWSSGLYQKYLDRPDSKLVSRLRDRDYRTALTLDSNFSHNRKFIVAGYGHGRVLIWTLFGEMIDPKIQEYGSVQNVSVSSDGQYATGTVFGKLHTEDQYNSTNKVWDFGSRNVVINDASKLLNHACKRLQYHHSFQFPKTTIAQRAKSSCQKFL